MVLPIVGDGTIVADDLAGVVLEAYDIGVECRAVVLRITGFPQDSIDGTTCRVAVKEFLVERAPHREILVEVTDDATEDSSKIYAPVTKARLIDAAGGYPRIRPEGLGDVTAEQALWAARYMVEQGQRRMCMRNYSLELTTIPKLGETCEMGDGFAGVVVQQPGIELGPGGSQHLELTLCDFTGGWD